MDMSGYLKQHWQDEHAEEYANGLKAKNNYTGLVEALAKHPSERVQAGCPQDDQFARLHDIGWSNN